MINCIRCKKAKAVCNCNRLCKNCNDDSYIKCSCERNESKIEIDENKIDDMPALIMKPSNDKEIAEYKAALESNIAKLESNNIDMLKLIDCVNESKSFIDSLRQENDIQKRLIENLTNELNQKNKSLQDDFSRVENIANNAINTLERRASTNTKDEIKKRLQRKKSADLLSKTESKK